MDCRWARQLRRAQAAAGLRDEPVFQATLEERHPTVLKRMSRSGRHLLVGPSFEGTTCNRLTVFGRNADVVDRT